MSSAIAFFAGSFFGGTMGVLLFLTLRNQGFTQSVSHAGGGKDNVWLQEVIEPPGRWP